MDVRRVSGFISAGLFLAGASLLWAQGNVFRASGDHAAIQYSTRATRDPVARLNQRIQSGEVQLAFDAPGGYLKSALKALGVPVSSQTLVYSANSLQREHISKAAPRAIYFNDTVWIGWEKGADSFEVAAEGW